MDPLALPDPGLVSRGPLRLDLAPPGHPLEVETIRFETPARHFRRHGLRPGSVVTRGEVTPSSVVLQLPGGRRVEMPRHLCESVAVRPAPRAG